MDQKFDALPDVVGQSELAHLLELEAIEAVCTTPVVSQWVPDVTVGKEEGSMQVKLA